MNEFGEDSMQQDVFEVRRDRFDLLDEQKYILQGNWPKEHQVEAFLDNEPISVLIEPWNLINSMERFDSLDLAKGEKITMVVPLPENLAKYRMLKVYAVQRGKRKLWFSQSVKKINEIKGKPYYYLEEVQQEAKNHSCTIRGWVTFKSPVTITITDEKGKEIRSDIQMNNRPDVAEIYSECDIDVKCGFYIEVANVKTNNINIIFTAKEAKTSKVIPMNGVAIAKARIAKYHEKGQRYLRTHGVKALVAKVFKKVVDRKEQNIPYSKWIEKHLPDKEELAWQRKEAFAISPKISIVVPLYKTPQKYLQALINSIKEQTYTNWELCLSDGSGKDSPLKDILTTYAKEDSRIRIVANEEPLKIADNTNKAIAIATGDYIAFADHDDELTKNALYECVQAINDKPATQVLYSDEDKMSGDGNQFFQPHFKPDFNIDLLCTVNYVCHLFVVKRDILEEVGVLRGEFDGAQDYDFILRCVEATANIHHIPKILYHWRSHEESTAENPESKLYAFTAGQRAVQAHYDRIGVKAEVVQGEFFGLNRTRFIRDYDPLISIVIPNKDHIDDLQRCMDSIESHSTYHNYEFIIIENNSTEPETFAYYKELEAKNGKVKVVYWDGVFNYAAINNFGVKYANGEYLLLLNNDTEIVNDDCLEEMLGYCMRDDVGIVGARLYYEDDTIQHAGVVIGFGGIAGHCFVMQPRSYTGYCHRIICAQDYSAVTAACLMVKKSVFDAVDGLTEELAVAFNDIDFCLKVREYGKLVVYNPYAELYHYESKSRGLEDTPEKRERFNREIMIFRKRWPEILRNGDPFYNPNLTLDSQDFSLKKV